MSSPDAAAGATERAGARGRALRIPAPLPEWAWYVVTLAVTGVLMVLSLRLWRADFHVPFVFSGDSVFYFMVGRELLDHGWYLTNARMGAPSGQQLYDFPIGSDNLNLLTLDFFVNVSRNAVVGVNLFFVFTFFANAASAFWVLRRWLVTPPAAAMASVLFALVPYHFLRSEAHLMLSAYYAVPLGVFLAVETMQGGLGIASRSRRAQLGRLLLCVIIASAGVYYAAFTLVLMATAVVIALARRERRAAAGAVVAGCLIVFLIALSNAPSLIYDHQHGKAQGVAVRLPIESEMYAQKLTTMILPLTVHRLPAFRDLRARYNDAGTAGGMPIGSVAAIGFVILCMVALLSAAGVGLRLSRRHPLRILGPLTVVLFVVATVGGVSSLIGYYVTPDVRAWERTSIVFDFFGLAAVAIVLDAALRRRGDAWRGFARVGACGLVICIGALDQTSNYFIPPYSVTGPEWRGTQTFVHKIERSLPRGSMVYQVPYVGFPEVPGVGKMGVYDPAIGYILSDSLRWSHGAMRGTAADWNAAIASAPLQDQVVRAEAAGFAGVWLDRFGYADGGAAEEAQIAKVAHVAPLVAPDGRYVFYSFGRLRSRLAAKTPASTLAAVGSATVHPVRLVLDGSFYPDETAGSDHWQWASKPAFSLEIVNSARARTVEITAILATGLSTPSNLTVAVGGRIVRRLVVQPGGGTPLRLTVRAPHGSLAVRFTSDAARTVSATDPRRLYVRVTNPAVATAGVSAAIKRLVRIAQ